MKKFLFFAIGALFIYACSKTSIEDVPTPNKKIYKVGDTCKGGYVFQKTSDYHGFIVINTNISNPWQLAKNNAVNYKKLPTCAQMDTIFRVQLRLKKSFGISGIYWLDGISGKTEQGIYNNGQCYLIPVNNKINIAYIVEF